MSIDKLDFNNTINVESEWFINENLDLAYFSVLASYSVPLDTSTDVDSNPLSVIDALISWHAPVRSSLMVQKRLVTCKEPSLKVPAKHKCQKPILFERFESEPISREISKDNDESPQFSHYGPSANRMVEKMDTTLSKGLA